MCRIVTAQVDQWYGAAVAGSDINIAECKIAEIGRLPHAVLYHPDIQESQSIRVKIDIRDGKILNKPGAGPCQAIHGIDKTYVRRRSIRPFCMNNIDAVDQIDPVYRIGSPAQLDDTSARHLPDDVIGNGNVSAVKDEAVVIDMKETIIDRAGIVACRDAVVGDLKAIDVYIVYAAIERIEHNIGGGSIGDRDPFDHVIMPPLDLDGIVNAGRTAGVVKRENIIGDDPSAIDHQGRAISVSPAGIEISPDETAVGQVDLGDGSGNVPEADRMHTRGKINDLFSARYTRIITGHRIDVCGCRIGNILRLLQGVRKQKQNVLIGRVIVKFDGQLCGFGKSELNRAAIADQGSADLSQAQPVWPDRCRAGGGIQFDHLYRNGLRERKDRIAESFPLLIIGHSAGRRAYIGEGRIRPAVLGNGHLVFSGIKIRNAQWSRGGYNLGSGGKGHTCDKQGQYDSVDHSRFELKLTIR